MASETSPLLAKPSEVIESSDAPIGPRLNDSEDIERPNGVSKPSDVESQHGDDGGEAATLYQGIPEAKKRLKYIVPAVAIGVKTQ